MKKFLDKQIKRIFRLIAIALISCLAIVILTIAPENKPEASNRIKGVWLTHVGNAFLTYTTLTDNVFYRLASLNYNRVYVDVYNNGTTYSSKYAPRNYLLSLPFTNPLKTAIATGKRHGLKVYAWYEHGMMTFGNAELARLHPEWILTTANGEKLIDRHWWLDPANIEVQEYFINLFVEVAASYPDLYGIQVDDHWGIPIQFGDKTIAMTELTNKVVEAVRKVRPNLVISLSPNPLGFSRKKYAQDWLSWLKSGLFDELVMQLYRPTSQEVKLAIDNSILLEASKYADIGIGLYAGSLEKQKSLPELQSQINLVKTTGYGYVLFPWETSIGFLRMNKWQDKQNYLTAI